MESITVLVVTGIDKDRDGVGGKAHTVATGSNA
jgi:hypothetical protein